MAPLSPFSPSIWRPWRFLPWSLCLHLKLQADPLVLFSVNLAPLTFSSLEPLLALETAWHPSRHIDLPIVLIFLSCSLFLPFFLFSSFRLFSSFLSSLFVSFPFLFSFFLAPLWWPRGARAPKAPPRYAPGLSQSMHLFLVHDTLYICLKFVYIMKQNSTLIHSCVNIIKDSGHIIYVRIRHSFAHLRTILNKIASTMVNFYWPFAFEHGQNITNITMIRKTNYAAL